MNPDSKKTDILIKAENFQQRLDFYWQFIVVYFVVLIVYALLKGSIEEGTFTIVLNDPVVILMTLFIIGTSIGLAIHYYKKNQIIVGRDFILMKSRFREKKYTNAEIIRISIGKERITKIRGAFHIIKIKLNSRKRVVRIRPSSYWNDRKLVHCITILKKNINR